MKPSPDIDVIFLEGGARELATGGRKIGRARQETPGENGDMATRTWNRLDGVALFTHRRPFFVNVPRLPPPAGTQCNGMFWETVLLEPLCCPMVSWLGPGVAQP